MNAALDARPSDASHPIPATALAKRLAGQPPVARALRRTKRATSDPIVALTRRLDLATYRAILRHPAWSFIRQAIVDTRSYDSGLDAGLQLLGHTETYRDVLDQQEIESHLITLCSFVLDMLDRLDEWEGYLAAWHLVRSHTSCCLTYESGAQFTHGPRLKPFILAEHGGLMRVHFLYLTLHRKAVIERKLERQRRGAKLGGVRHASQDELSDAEIRERFEAVAELAREAARQPW